MTKRNSAAADWPLRRRLSGAVCMLVMSGVMAGGMFFSYRTISDWSTWPSVITFQHGALFILLLPLFIVPCIVTLFLPVFLNKNISDKVSVRCIKFVFAVWVGWIPLEIVTFWTYSHEIEYRGYIKCSGIPIGYTPGRAGATRYALYEELCKKH